jgi:hypothetical protein
MRQDTRHRLPRAWLYYWKPEQAASESGVLDYAGGQQLQKLRRGDILWIYTTLNRGVPFLAGRMRVGAVLSRRAAFRLRKGDIWDADWHVFAAKGEHESFRLIPLATVAPVLSFESNADRFAVRQGRIRGQQVRAIRLLTERSAKQLELLWSHRQSPELENVSTFEVPEADSRVKTLREIAIRPEQAEFRRRVVNAYDGRCAVSGCGVLPALSAAHIAPYSGPNSNHPQNGILLRLDLHALFDAGLIRVSPATFRVTTDAALNDSEYSRYNGRSLHVPSSPDLRPSKQALSRRSQLLSSE